MKKAEDEFEDGEEGDEEKEQPEEPEPETGPQLLTSVAEDASECYSLESTDKHHPPPPPPPPTSHTAEVDNLPPWSTRLTSAIVPQYAMAVISSNLWPGAHAIAAGKSVLSHTHKHRDKE